MKYIQSCWDLDPDTQSENQHAHLQLAACSKALNFVIPVADLSCSQRLLTPGPQPIAQTYVRLILKSHWYMTLTNKRHPSESNCGPHFRCSHFVRQGRSVQDHPVALGHAMPGYHTLHLGRMEFLREHSLATAGPVSLPLRPHEAAWLPSLGRRQRLWYCSEDWRQQPSAGRRRWEGKAGLCGSGSGGTAGSKSRGNVGKTKSKQKPFAMSHLTFVAILKSRNSVKCL